MVLSPLLTYSPESREADVLVEDLNLVEPNLTQHVQLEQQGPWGVLLFDVGKDMVPVGFVLEPGQVK
jgi:hypothetical protein